MTRHRAVWEDDEPVLDRALRELVLEREHDDREKQRAMGAGAAQLAANLCESMQSEAVTIPAGTPIVACRWCGASVCWVPSRATAHRKKQYKESVSIDREPTTEREGQGYPHIAVCGGSGLRQIVA